MPVTKPSEVPRWADGGSNTPTNVTDPPEHNSSIAAWATGQTYGTTNGNGYTVTSSGSYWTIQSYAGTGTSANAPTGTGPTFVDNAGANQITWLYIGSVTVTKDSGWLPNFQPPAQVFNWLFFIIYQWILWLQDIGEQDFSGGTNGPWTGFHIFTGGSGTSPPIAVDAGVSGPGGQTPGIVSTGGQNPSGPAGPGLVGNGGNDLGGGGAPGVIGNGSDTQPGVSCVGGTSGTTGGGPGCKGVGGPGALGGMFQGGPAPTGGGTAGVGVQGTGGAGNCSGIYGTCSGTASAVIGINSNSGAGVGGISNTGPGVEGQSASGPGVHGVGNASSAGVLGESAYVTTAGVTGQNSGDGPGVYGSSSALGPGVSCSNSSTGLALAIGAGNAAFVGATSPAAGVAAPVNDFLSPSNVQKGWGTIEIVGAGVINLLDSHNCSAQFISGTVLQINLLRPMKSGTVNYKVTHNLSGGGQYFGQVFNKTASSFQVTFLPMSGSPTAFDFTAGSFGWIWDFDVSGRQS